MNAGEKEMPSSFATEPPRRRPIYGPEFVGPFPAGAIERAADGNLFMVLFAPGPDGSWSQHINEKRSET